MPLAQSDVRQLDAMRQELDSMAKMLSGQEKRLDTHIDTLPSQLQEAVEQALKRQPQMTREQQKYLEIATELASQRLAFRKSIIEKTTVGALMMVMGLLATGIGVVLMDFLVAHGWKR